MNFRIYRILTIRILIIPLMVFLVSGCKSDDEDGSSSNGSVVPGVIDAEGGFNVKVNPPSNTHYYIHKAGDFTAPCVVAANATAYADLDITCILEVEELEGAYQTANGGLKMVMNTPPGMCRYVTYYPYFYFGRDYGVGPTAVTVTFDAAGNFVAGSSSITGPGYWSPDGTGTPICNFNYNSSDGPDCCYGTYTLTTDQAGTVTSSTQEWTGAPGNCAAGSGAETAPKTEDTNMPVPVVLFQPNGFNDEFATGTLSPLMSAYSSLYYANYYSGVIPTAFKDGATYEANPYYEWTCLDDASELLARIRVQIREWNEKSEFDLGSSGDPDTTGVETNWGDAINDYRDWLDVVTNGNTFPGIP